MSVLPASKSLASTGATAELFDEAACVWACAFGAWTNYLSRLATSRSPLAAFEAGVQYFGDSLQIGDRAAADRLRHAGSVKPLLNDT